jgi:hypothetical protein
MLNKQLALLRADFALLEGAMLQMEYSIQKCKHLIEMPVEAYTPEALEHIEAYRARFARLPNMCLKKIIRNIAVMEGYATNSFRETLELGSKLGFIANAIILLEIRVFRNEIAHDYIPLLQSKIFV